MSKISLLAWAKKNNVSYSRAQAFVTRGQITVDRVGGRVLIEEDFPAPEEKKIACMLCGAKVAQITGSHLKAHGITLAEYKVKWPSSPIVCEEVSATISNALTGIERSEEFKANVSNGRKGIRPTDHRRYEKGAYSPSEETRKRMSEAHLGRKHSEETKAKIGDAHRGKKIPPEDVRRRAEHLKERYASGELAAFWKGKKLPESARQKLSDRKKAFYASMSPEERKERAAKAAEKLRGMSRTPEQRERYREAVLKRMEEHPESFKFKDTSLELHFKEWCEENDFEFRQQCFVTYNGRRHPYDFYLPELNMLVECDGPLHWAPPYFTPKGMGKDEAFERQKEKDDFWTKAALDLGYVIVRLVGIKRIGDEGSGDAWEQIEKWLEAQEEASLDTWK